MKSYILTAINLAATFSGLLAIAAYLDTRPLINAEHALADAADPIYQRKHQDAIDADIARYTACLAFMDANGKPIPTPAMRDCMLNAMPKVTTWAGSIGFASMSSYWLQTHPDDASIRTAALGTVNGGWEEIRHLMPLFALQDKVTEAHDRSFFMRVRDGTYGHRLAYETYADALEKQEAYILAPELLDKQRQRRVDLIHEKT